MDSAIQYLVQHKLKEQNRYQVINIPSRLGTKNRTSYRRLKKNTDQILLDWKDPTSYTVKRRKEKTHFLINRVIYV